MPNSQFHQLLESARQGDPEALNRLLLSLQGELRRVVRRSRHRRQGLGLRTTELFNEAYLKVFQRQIPGFTDQEHLIAMWARATSWVIVEAWRRRGSRPQLDELVEETVGEGVARTGGTLVEVQQAIEELKEVMPREGLAAEMRLLNGMSTGEVAELLDRSEPTVRRWVRSASAWIRIHIQEGGTSVRVPKD